MPGIIGKKICMTRLFEDNGRVIPVTVIKCDPNTVTQVKTVKNDGYPAIVLGFSELKKPTKNKKFRTLKEFPLNENQEVKTGDKVNVSALNEIKEVCVTGVSKGKGFQGTIKRHNFSRGPETHGSHHHREPGSIGACTKPGRVHRGKKMAGRMGGDTITLSRVKVVKIDEKNNLIALKGAIPGANNDTISIKF